MTAAVEPRADIPALTGIRGIAAWAVVLYHIRLSLAWTLPDEAVAMLGKGYLAVDLFFMLSGFVLWLNYSDKLRREGFRAFPGFIGRRIARIWPLHIATLAGAVLFASAAFALGKPVAEPWNHLPLHILLIHNWGFTSVLGWNTPSWSISGEFAAYLLFPLLALATDWRRFRPAMLVFLLVLLAYLLHEAMAAGGATLLDHDIPRLGIFRALIGFAMGTILCALWLQWRDGRRRALKVAGALLLLYLALTARWAPETAVAPPALAGLLFLVALTADARGNPLASRPIHYLGTISYSTYLVHMLLFGLFKIVFVEEALRMSLAEAGLFLLLTFLASVVLFQRIERPAQRALNRVWDRGLKLRPAPRPAAEPGG
jgi:peptidoglycan/LPS O-acetylase OafA/YrhL